MSGTPPPAVSWERPEPMVGPAPGIEFAGHGARLVAYLLDCVIVSLLEIPIFVFGLFLLRSGEALVDRRTIVTDTAAVVGLLLLLFIGFVVALLYFPFFWARGGQTLGMKPFGLRVVRDRDGSRIGWGTALLRLLGLYVAGSVLYLGFIWIFIDKRRRGWHDLIAGTVVVKQP